MDAVIVRFDGRQTRMRAYTGDICDDAARTFIVVRSKSICEENRRLEREIRRVRKCGLRK